MGMHELDEFSSPEYDQDMGRFIKDVRKIEGLTAEELGARVGLTQNYMSRLENGGIRNPSYAVVARLAKELSKAKAVRSSDFPLDAYQSSFADLVKYYVHAEQISRDTAQDRYHGKFAHLHNNIHNLTVEDVAVIDQYIDTVTLRRAVVPLVDTLRQRTVTLSDFSRLLKEFADYLCSDIEEVEYLRAIYTKTVIAPSEEDKAEYLIRDILNHFHLYIEQTAWSSPKEG